MSTYKTLGGLALASGLWLMASASAAAMQPGAPMELGPAALAPKGYMAFCERRPQECGSDSYAVLANARRVEADRAALLGPPASPPGSVPGTAPTTGGPFRGEPAPYGDLAPVPEPLTVSLERAPAVSSVAFIDPTRDPVATPASPPAMSPNLWRLLNRVNGKVNARIQAVTDAVGYGVEDYWTTPLEERRAFGDCEDFVLEKQRALVAAGIPRNALNIAIVTTSWGETHAVLLVNTSQGEFVLDNLNRAITPWHLARYSWRQREVGGDPFTWAMIKSYAGDASRS